jgi:shikimate kinase
MSVIAIVGMPGSGKTTVGRHLAKRLNLRFVDSDHEIERELGCSIKHYFDIQGEPAFRDVEHNVIANLCHSRPDDGRAGTVISTGGGVVLRSDNRHELRANTWVVYLRSSPAELAKRLRFDTVRPLLQGGNAAKRLQDLFDQRDNFYKETAHFTVDTGRPSVHMLVNTIAMQFEMRGLTQLSGGVSPLP